jgi:hypothetical protein
LKKLSPDTLPKKKDERLIPVSSKMAEQMFVSGFMRGPMKLSELIVKKG